MPLSRNRPAWCCAALALSGLSPAFAGEIEHERLAAFVRQIDLIEAQAGDLAEAAQTHRARYHFDYTRLRDDLARLRAGIADYLTPPRAQPRDLEPMVAEYTRAWPDPGDTP